MDRRRAFEILQLDLEFLAALGFDFAEVADVAFVLQHLEHARAQRRSRSRQLRAAAHLRVADAGDQIADGIVDVHLIVLPYQLDLIMPGIWPLEARSRSAIRESFTLR